jgi:hypothetical protein
MPRKVESKAEFASRVDEKKPAASKPRSAAGDRARSSAAKSKRPGKSARPLATSTGNPRIAKADGDAPVQAYLAALPGWKRDVGRRLDALIARTVPGVRKAVKWNSPLYGVEGQGWFLGLHTFTSYLKVAFFRGTSLRPVPPGDSKSKETRYLDLHEGDELDEAQVAKWIRQAAALPGWGAPGRKKSGRIERAGTAKTRGREPASEQPASRRIDQRIRDLAGWRGETLARLRALIQKADPEITEEWKWAVPVWSHEGIVCTGEAYTKVVKLTFARGAELPDPLHLFNASLAGNTRRAIDVHAGEQVDARAFQALVKAAVARNRARAKER